MYFSSDVTRWPRDDLLLIRSTANENITPSPTLTNFFLRAPVGIVEKSWELIAGPLLERGLNQRTKLPRRISRREVYRPEWINRVFQSPITRKGACKFRNGGKTAPSYLP